jgi:hypothetical protein
MNLDSIEWHFDEYWMKCDGLADDAKKRTSREPAAAAW